jgi:hypothetical protein
MRTQTSRTTTRSSRSRWTSRSRGF